MRPHLIACLIVLSSFLIIKPTLADTCSDYRQKTGLDLNEAECYVLERVEKREVAHFLELHEKGAEFQKRFFRIEDRTLRANFLHRLSIGAMPGFEVSEKGVSIGNALLSEDLNLEGAKIPFPLQLFNCTFEKIVNFKGAQFSAEAGFSMSKFTDKVSFNETTFSSHVYFGNAQFLNSALFVKTQFLASVSFPGAKFLAVAEFGGAQFSAKVLFNGSQFSDKTYFGSAQFLDETDFIGAQFSAESYFDRTEFSNEADFTAAQFSAGIYFFRTIFSKKPNFSWCRFKESIDFRRSLFPEKLMPDIPFNNVTGFSNMQVEWEYNPEKFGKEENVKQAKRRGLKNRLEYNETFYIALIKNYRDMGWFREADDAYYTYRVEKRKHRLDKLLSQNQGGVTKSFSSDSWWSKPLLYLEWLFLDRTFGYGVKPWKLFKSYVFLWLIFVPIYVFFLRLHYQYGRKTRWHWPRKIIRSVVHSIDTLTPGINLYAFTELRPFYFDTSSLWKKLLLNFFHRSQQILGWYWAALFLILFSKIWIR